MEFEQWLDQHLLPSLKIPSVLIIDNSPIHRAVSYTHLRAHET